MSIPSSLRGSMAAALLACPSALAQSTDTLQGFNLERLETNVGRGTLLLGNGELMTPGGLSVSLLGHYQYLPLSLDDGDLRLRVVQHRATGLLSASYGVLPWLELSAQLPIVLWQEGEDPTPLGLSPVSAQGLGTPVLQARLGLLSRRHRQPVDLSADLGVGLPVGTINALAGDAGPRFHARMVMGTTLGWVQPSLEAGVLFRPTPSVSVAEGESAGATAEVRLGAALATTGEGLKGELGLRATLSRSVSMDVLGGVRFPLLAGLDAFILGGPGIGGALGTPLFRVLAGVSFRQEPRPRIEGLDRALNQEIQLVLDNPVPPPREVPVRAAGNWEFNSLARGEPGGTASGEQAAQGLPRPYQHQPGPKTRVLMQGPLYFSEGESALPGVVPLLDQAAQGLVEKARAGRILIEAHADAGGEGSSPSHVMSMQRALAVRRYLIALGLPPAQVEVRYFGADWPVSKRPATDQERQLNRRVDVLVLDQDEAATTQAPAP